jgi:hypothetical protein
MNARSYFFPRLSAEFKSAGTAVVLLASVGVLLSVPCGFFSAADELLSVVDELLAEANELLAVAGAASLSDGSVTLGDTVSTVAGPYLIVESTGTSVESKGAVAVAVAVDPGETGVTVVLAEDGGAVPEGNDVVPVEDGGAVAGIVEACASACSAGAAVEVSSAADEVSPLSAELSIFKKLHAVRLII